MRVSNHRTGGVLTLAFCVGLSAVVGACSSTPSASVAAPTAVPTPVITPDPHLTEPATADQIFHAIRKGDLPLSVNNATTGGLSSPFVKQINAQVGNWPLIITEYRTSAQLHDNAGWDPGTGPTQGEAPYAWAGMNVLVAFGPITGLPTQPDAMRVQQAKDLVALIDPLLWPMEQRSITPVATKGAPPQVSAQPSPAASAAASAAP
jgi:hypothetical protein